MNKCMNKKVSETSNETIYFLFQVITKPDDEFHQQKKIHKKKEEKKDPAAKPTSLFPESRNYSTHEKLRDS